MKITQPPFRKLRGYAFDPLLSNQSATADINSVIYRINWESLQPGPIGEYVEVIDYDPTIKKFYEAVDLNHPYLLAQDGLAPSESNPQFHQQMVYAVAMTTIQNFEQALGRKVIWAPRRLADRRKYQEYVQCLRIYPHALREANAYYTPQKKALLFGYFAATPANPAQQMPGSLVFACLSHDIIAHETTHAILDGMHRFYNEPSNPDVLAFHEAFADIVALFQHFTFPEVLKRQIAETKGDLAAQNLLGKLAQEFGTGIGNYGSLRDAIGTDESGKWEPKQPKVEDYLNTAEPHDRGSILVAAVFEAFINIYKNRVADLLRIASNGTGILPRGELHPDLVNRLAGEAAKAAGHVLSMCVRALDYCPPVDLTFGEYLRAIITADTDLIADDSHKYRLILIEAFRRRGIYPQGIKTLSVESLRYPLEPAANFEKSGFHPGLCGGSVIPPVYRPRLKSGWSAMLTPVRENTASARPSLSCASPRRSRWPITKRRGRSWARAVTRGKERPRFQRAAQRGALGSPRGRRRNQRSDPGDCHGLLGEVLRKNTEDRIAQEGIAIKINRPARNECSYIFPCHAGHR